MATAGKVAPTPKDKFVNGTAYDKLDVVEYNGTLYIAKKASAGVLPDDPEYWMLAVDLTGKLDTTGDTENNTVTFESGDEADPTAWKNVATLTSKEKHSSLLKKISTMFSNVRYLYKLLGTTDISALGSVTEAIATISGNVGNMKGISSSAAITTEGEYALDAREKNASVEGTLANQIDVLNSNLSQCRVDKLWEGRVGSGTTINFSKSLADYPSARRLILVFNRIDFNQTINIEVPRIIWDMTTNYGNNSEIFDDYVHICNVPATDLTNTSIYVNWSSNSDYGLISVYIEY